MRIFFKLFRKLFRLFVVLGILLTLGIVACNLWVIFSTRDDIYKTVTEVPANNVALVLGTSKYSRSGHTNLFFKYRMVAAGKLYASGKAKHFIASGDNSLSYYNEPQDMKKALLAEGIPKDRISLDYAGFRTFDSVVRCKKVFGQEKITIVTQNFHCYRALFIAKFYDMKAVGFASGGIPDGHSPWTLFREYLARCKAVIDLYILRKKPKFLGDPIRIKFENGN